jgi:hypothetical protein
MNQRTRRKSGLEHHTSCSLLFPYSRRHIFYPLSRYTKEESFLWAIPGRSARSIAICGIPLPLVLLRRWEGGKSPDLGLYIARSSRLSASGVVGAAMLAARVLAVAFFPSAGGGPWITAVERVPSRCTSFFGLGEHPTRSGYAVDLEFRFFLRIHPG